MSVPDDDGTAAKLGRAAGDRMREVCREAGVSEPVDIEMYTSFGPPKRVRIFEPESDPRPEGGQS